MDNNDFKQKFENFRSFFEDKSGLRINASIVKHKGKIYCTCRTRHLYGFDSHSCLMELDADFKVTNVKPLRAANNNNAFEDARLFSAGDVLLAFYTYLPCVDGEWFWDYGVGFGVV